MRPGPAPPCLFGQRGATLDYVDCKDCGGEHKNAAPRGRSPAQWIRPGRNERRRGRMGHGLLEARLCRSACRWQRARRRLQPARAARRLVARSTSNCPGDEHGPSTITTFPIPTMACASPATRPVSRPPSSFHRNGDFLGGQRRVELQVILVAEVELQRMLALRQGDTVSV